MIGSSGIRLANVSSLSKPLQANPFLKNGLKCVFAFIFCIDRKPIAKPFRKWLKDVITAVRKQGKYELELVQEHHSLLSKC
jgi:hypothetical protein